MSSSMAGGSGYRTGTGNTGQKVGGYKVGQLQQFDPQQMELYQRGYSQVSPDSYTSRLANGDQSLFDQMEEPAMRQFNGLQGNIASRFSAGGGGAGAMSGRRSSAFQNTMSAASNNFASDLASRRQGLQRQAIMDLQSMSNSLLGQRPNEQFLIQPNEKQSFGQQMMQGALPLAGMAGAGFMSGWNPAAMQAGYGAGNAAAQGFNY